MWNSLPLFIRSSAFISIFKAKLIKKNFLDKYVHIMTVSFVQCVYVLTVWCLEIIPLFFTPCLILCYASLIKIVETLKVQVGHSSFACKDVNRHDLVVFL